jgi:hypothetical protein
MLDDIHGSAFVHPRIEHVRHGRLPRIVEV